MKRGEQCDVTAVAWVPAVTRSCRLCPVPMTQHAGARLCVKLHHHFSAVSTRMRNASTASLPKPIKNCMTQETRPGLVIGNAWCVARRSMPTSFHHRSRRTSHTVYASIWRTACCQGNRLRVACSRCCDVVEEVFSKLSIAWTVSSFAATGHLCTNCHQILWQHSCQDSTDFLTWFLSSFSTYTRLDVLCCPWSDCGVGQVLCVIRCATTIPESLTVLIVHKELMMYRS